MKLKGSEVEIDKTILEGLSNPLTHMVRNAVDHGIELANSVHREERASKPEVTFGIRRAMPQRC